MRTTAKILSYLFHPLLIPTYAFLLAFTFSPGLLFYLDSQGVANIFLKIFFNTFFFPVIVVFLMSKLEFVDSIFLKTKKERIIPYIGVSVFFSWSVITFRNMSVPPILFQILLGATIAIFVAFIVNIFTKISMHTTAMGSLVIVTLSLSLTSDFNLKLLLMAVFVIAGLVGTCRLLLDRHKPYDVYLGYFVGIISQIVAFNF